MNRPGVAVVAGSTGHDQISCNRHRRAQEVPVGGIGMTQLLFLLPIPSGRVDSKHVNRAHRIDSVAGPQSSGNYSVPFDCHRFTELSAEGSRRILDSRDIPLLLVSTNLRDIRQSWEDANRAGIAAVLHLLRGPLDAVSKSNIPIDGVIYTISLFQLLDTGGQPRDVSRFGQLPRSAEILAAQLSGATLTIEGSGFSITATVNSAAAVSEPARAFFRPSGSPQ